MKTTATLAIALALGSATADRAAFQPSRPNGFHVATNSAIRVKSFSFSSVDEALKSLGAEYEIAKQYTSKHNGVKHTYLRQVVNGIPVQNCVAQINSKNGKVLSFSNSFFTGEVPALKLTGLRIDPEEATSRYMKFLEAPASGCRNEVEPSLRYVATDDGSLTLAYRIVCDMNESDNWMESYVSAETGKVVSQIDYFHNADSAEATSGTYNVYAIPDIDPGLANNIPQIVSQPHANAYPAEASTLGWHDQGDGKTFNTTIGNNVYAQEHLVQGPGFLDYYRPDGGADLIFNKTYDFTKQPGEEPNLDSAIANLFYLNNLVHDIFYGYGFDEESGNFQENNMGRGGLGGDAVEANAQDAGNILGRKNNANFATGPDGQRPRMRMYVWDGDIGDGVARFDPERDGDLDGGIVFHEYGHGITTRLTGGADDASCLGDTHTGAGMGEGWGDFFGKIVTLKATSEAMDEQPMGDWLRPGGIRNFPYSRDMGVNPLTFANLNARPYSSSVHAAGTVWCTVLWDAMWAMIDVYGWDADIRACGTGGNNKMLQLVVDGLKLQPCKPTMLDARDAIILADEVTYDGVNACTLWNAFARRGFGVGAIAGTDRVTYVESFETTDSCKVAKAVA